MRSQPSLFDPLPADPTGPLVRVRLTVAYHGAGFRGFAANPGVRTVAGLLEAAISQLLGHGVAIGCAGRTDAGVHARGQVVTFDANAERLDLDRLVAGVNALCGPEVVVRDAAIVDDGFDARHSAVARVYHYVICNRPEPDPFTAATAWHVRDPLDVRRMGMAGDPLIGEHDFAAFCRRPKVNDIGDGGDGHRPSLVRRVIDARWDDVGDGFLRFRIEANAFCHQMVRSIVGTHVAVGRGRLTPGDIAGILRSGDRHRAGDLAPPHGLTLWEVRYA